jgi:hypothetical protein
MRLRMEYPAEGITATDREIIDHLDIGIGLMQLAAGIERCEHGIVITTEPESPEEEDARANLGKPAALAISHE